MTTKNSMQSIDVPAPHLVTAHTGPLYYVEKMILDQVATIESWFREQWQKTPAPITGSVDLRHAGFKLAPVDMNLFPAGFNNLNRDSLPLCIQAVQSVLAHGVPRCTKILILPESHTRNQYYFDSLSLLRSIFIKAGFIVRVGSLDPLLTESIPIKTGAGDAFSIEPVVRRGSRLGLADFDPCLLLLNNDLSTGIPDVLQGLSQPIQPLAQLGWSTRLKSSHFQIYDDVASEFSTLIHLDPWFINPFFGAVDGVDFMAQVGLESLAAEIDRILDQIRAQYAIHGIQEKPFVAVKADSGTYGMSVIMMYAGEEALRLNRKQRTRMAASKGGRAVTRVMIQEGVHSFETMPNGAVAEPVVYMIGPFVVGGFYRVHQGRGKDDNLNAPGMHFEPLAFADVCNMPREDLGERSRVNRFYAYGVIARLSALAAAREAQVLGVLS